LLEQIKAAIQAARGSALPKSALAKACDYTLGGSYLTLFAVLGDSDCCAERSLDLSLVGTHGREKHTVEPVQFGTPPAFFCSYDQCFCLRYCLKGLGSTIRKVQDFSLECEPIRHDQHSALVTNSRIGC
jgi:hypothetical protein